MNTQFSAALNRQLFYQPDIQSFHWVKFQGQNNDVLYALSGIIPVNTTGNSKSWLNVAVSCKINIPELPAGAGLYLNYYSPFASLNAIFNKDNTVNGGHAVNSFNIIPFRADGEYGSTSVNLTLDLGVSDSDATILKIGFNIILAGNFRPLDPCKSEEEVFATLKMQCNGGYEAEIELYRNNLAKASAAERPGILEQITNLQALLNSCPTALRAAENALNQCRLRPVPPVSTK